MQIRSYPVEAPLPTYHHEGFACCPGNPLPFGASLVPGGVNFSLASRHATACTLVLFKTGELLPLVEIPLPPEFKIGDVYCITVLDIDHREIEYGYRLDGPFDPANGHRFDPDVILMDPYARVITGREVWGEEPDYDDIYPHRARLNARPFDWGIDRPLKRPIEDTVMYEMHVRGFTRHPSSGVDNPGSFDGLRQKIPYLKHLGVNCVELMPVFEFDEFEHSRIHEETGERLMNYWGYSPLGFFALKAGYSASPIAEDALDEFKALVKELHASDIEVILDVVFNHTAEGNDKGPSYSFKGIDNRIYYILTPEGYYYNFSGTGNTFNCNHPRVRPLILDSLRYWVSEFHVDGFRFDLASIMTRDVDGMPLEDPPILREMVDDPVLGTCKLIAEPWDADGLYHQGSFPAYGRWVEWNGQYRDTLRRFVKGDEGQIGAMAQGIQGSPDLYPGRGPIATINFVTAHDGFTLRDMVSYNEKHNLANGEDNRDGMNHNNSWNCGIEGPTDDPAINELRNRQVRNALAILLMSQGVPMLSMGDEMGRTRHGNNNGYCHDTELAWLDWNLLHENGDLFEFTRRLIRFRLNHPMLRNGYHLRHEDYKEEGYPDITWHGRHVGRPEWGRKSRVLAFMLNGAYAKGGLFHDDYIYMAMNMHWQNKTFYLPPIPHGKQWHVFCNTGALPHEIIFEPGEELWLPDQSSIWMKSRSVLVLVGK